MPQSISSLKQKAQRLQDSDITWIKAPAPTMCLKAKKGDNIEEGSREEHSKNYFEPRLMVQLDELCWL